MKLSMDSRDLNDGLNVVSHALGVAKREADSGLSGVLLCANSDGVTLSCCNGVISIETELTADVAEGGMMLIKGDLFCSLAKTLKSGRVSLKDTGDGSVEIRSHSAKMNLSVMDAELFTAVPAPEGGTLVKLPSVIFKDMINRSAYATATDETRPMLKGCLMEITPGNAFIVALDGFRMATMQYKDENVSIPKNMEKVTGLISGDLLITLSRILPDEDTLVEILLGDNKVQVSFGSTRAVFVKMGSDFVDYKRIIPTSFASEACLNRTEFLNAIQRAAVVARWDGNLLARLSFSSEGVRVTAQSVSGSYEEVLDALYSGPAIDICFNADYIVKFLQNISDEKFYLKMNGPTSPAAITPCSGDSFFHVVLPVRTAR